MRTVRTAAGETVEDACENESDNGQYDQQDSPPGVFVVHAHVHTERVLGRSRLGRSYIDVHRTRNDDECLAKLTFRQRREA